MENGIQQVEELVKVVRVSQEIIYPDNCIVVPKKDVINLLKRLEVVKRNLQALLV